MSAKIEAAGPPEAIMIPTQGGQSSDSFGEGGLDKGLDYAIGANNTILVQKLAVESGDSQTNSKQVPPIGKVAQKTVFATVEAGSPLLNVSSPKRKSVLSRASKASPKVGGHASSP